MICSGTTIKSRDPLGVKELYYIKTEKGYCFSSNIGDFFEVYGLKKRPNLRSMRTIMQCFAVDYHETMYEGVYRLPPGHRIHIEGGKTRIDRYWFPENIEINYSITEEEAALKG
jgi:asparagine synthase (glutamine-hydrolysing)